jgi:DNA-binding response OmpR family regulator
VSFSVLVIDDEPDIRRLLERYLQKQGADTSLAEDGEKGLKAARAKLPDLIICDIQLPGISGIEVCQALKRDSKTCSIPILIITGNDKEGQEVICLELGADDYLVKPFELPLLRAHVNALLRRGAYLGHKSNVVLKGPLKLDVAGKVVHLRGREYPQLTPKEFDILHHLVLHEPTPLSRETLYRKSWGVPSADKSMLRTVDVHIQRIRSKLGLDRKSGLQAVSGRGYRWTTPDA